MHRATGLPVPGTVIGMILLFAGLCLAGREGTPVSLPAADGLLSYLALFFVPPGVGAALRVASLAQSWPAVAGVRDPRARGLATGVTAHGIGTARMLAESPEAGAFSGLAMGLAGFAVGVLMPLLSTLLGG